MDTRFLVWPNTTCCGRRLLLLHEAGALRCASRLSAWALPILILHKWYCQRPPFNCSSFRWRHHDLFDSLQWERCWSLAARPQHSLPVGRYVDDGVLPTEMWSYQYHSEKEAHEVHIFTSVSIPGRVFLFPGIREWRAPGNDVYYDLWGTDDKKNLLTTCCMQVLLLIFINYKNGETS